MTNTTRITKTIAQAAGNDAGNRAMRAGGRSVWSAEDANVAAHHAMELMILGGLMTIEMAIACGFEQA